MSETETPGARRTVGAALADALARAGVKVAFTVPGESILGILDALAARRVRVVATRHEGAASFMAEAVGQLTGRPAVVLATRGPGAANLAVGLHTARQDSAPLIAIVGQVRREVIGREAFQEMDVVETFAPIVKWTAEAREASDIPVLIERAIAAATRGRPGPVLLSVPEDLIDLELPEGGDAQVAHAPHAEQHPEPDPTLVRKVLHLLADSRRPLILAGAGVLRARSTDALVRFAETVRIPVVAAWRRPDVFPNDHPLYLGMTGLGAPANVRARIDEADALLVLGCRLGEHTSFGYEIPGEGTRWAHVDLEPRGAQGVRTPPEIAMAADVAGFLRVARRVLSRAAFEATSFDARTAANVEDRAAYEAAAVVDTAAWDGPGVHPGRVVETLARVLPAEAIVTTDAGDFGLWAARAYRFRRPGTFLGPTSGAMGYGLPAAIAASFARPGRVAVSLAGDGGFAMTMAELETAVRERAHVVALVFDNGRYGTIWRHQQQRGGTAGLGTELGPVDFASIANACGALGIAVRSDDEFEPALHQALEAGRPALVHLALDRSWTTPDRVGAVTGTPRPLTAEAAAEPAPPPESGEDAGATAAEVEAGTEEERPAPAEPSTDAVPSPVEPADEAGEAMSAEPEPTADAEPEGLDEPAPEADADAGAEPEAEPAAEPEPPAEPEAEAGAEPEAEAAAIAADESVAALESTPEA